MNTLITINVAFDPEEFSTVQVSDSVEAAFMEFHRVVKLYSRFDDASELSELNRQAGNWHEVSDEFYRLVEYMLDLASKTDGAFDPTIIDILEAYGYDKKYDFSKLDDPELEAKIEKLVKTRARWDQIELKKESGKNLVKLMPGQRIELGGVGKGYAIDLAWEKLKCLRNFVIDAGGDLRALGKNEEGKPWRLGLKHRFNENEDAVFGTIETEDISLASSGSWARRVKNFHHILHPTTGKPVSSYTTVFVAAPTGMMSDSWATALFVGGESLLAQAPEGLSAMWIDSANQAQISEGFPEFA